MKRADVLLTERGLTPSRSKAQELIASGDVEVFRAGEWRPVTQASLKISPDEELRVREGSLALRYVSRGGLKLESALGHLNLNVTGWRVLDLGISTGGFTDCLLRHGAREVCGVDVGHGQLDSRLANDSRVTAFEGVHVKDLGAHEGVREWLKGGCDLAVADLSFISFAQALPQFAEVLPARLLALIKPQFEVGRETATPAHFDDVRRRVLLALEKCGLKVEDYFASQVRGQDGNQEFFVLAHRPDPADGLSDQNDPP